MPRRAKKKQNVEKVLLLVLALVLLVGLGWAAVKHSDKSKTSATDTQPSASASPGTAASPAATAAAGQSTYTNPYNGYSVKYPQGWFVEAATSAAATVVLSSEDETKLPGHSVSGDANFYEVEIQPLSNPKNLSLTQFLAQRDSEIAGDSGHAPTVTNTSSVSAGGTTATARTATNNGVTNYELYVPHGTTVYRFVGSANSAFASTFNSISQSVTFQ